MAYNFFTQPQGPTIDISLFGDAQTQGIAAGKALPTPTTAALQGITEGINQGIEWLGKQQQLRDNQMELTLKQNQLERLDITNQIQDQQLAEAKLKVERDTATQKNQIAATNAQLQAQQQKDAIRVEWGQLVAKGDIQGQLAQWDKYAQVLSKTEAENFAQSVYTSNNPAITPEQKDRMYQWFTRNKAGDAASRILQKDIDGYEANIGKMHKLAGDWKKSAGLSPNTPDDEFAMDGYTMYPQGKYETEKVPGGFYRLKRVGKNFVETGTPIIKDMFMFVRDSDGRVLGENITKEVADAQGSAYNAQRGWDGSLKRGADTWAAAKKARSEGAGSYRNASSQEMALSQVGVGGAPTLEEASSIAMQSVPKYVQDEARAYPSITNTVAAIWSGGPATAKAQAMPEEFYRNPTTVRMLTQIDRTARNAVARGKDDDVHEQFMAAGAATDTLSREMAKVEFDRVSDNPAWSQAAVDERNRKLMKELRAKSVYYTREQSAWDDLTDFAMGEELPHPELNREAAIAREYERRKFKSPFDMYYRENEAKLKEASLNIFIATRDYYGTLANRMRPSDGTARGKLSENLGSIASNTPSSPTQYRQR